MKIQARKIGLEIEEGLKKRNFKYWKNKSQTKNSKNVTYRI